ncbi:MAG TPA: hypothetical protein DEO64_09535 [Alcaligenes faecalis]|nr:hypothetical protein [Alcaligenes faecalis]
MRALVANKPPSFVFFLAIENAALVLTFVGTGGGLLAGSRTAVLTSKKRALAVAAQKSVRLRLSLYGGRN